MPSGGSATLTLTSRPAVVGTLSSTATVSANQTDLTPANNSVAMVTTTVNVPVLTVIRLGGNVRLSWPANSAFKLQSNESLNPAGWVDAVGTPLVDGGQNVVNSSVAGGAKFYRLRSP